MTPTDTIERVGRALKSFVAAEMLETGSVNTTRWQDMARAAIEAMREPSLEMLTAMKPWTEASGHPELVWRAGIAAALGQGGV